MPGRPDAVGGRGTLVGCDKDPNMGRGTLVGSGNVLGKIGTDMGGATPDGKDVRLEGTTAVGRNGAPGEKSDAADAEGVEPNKGDDEPIASLDDPPAEVNTMPGHGGVAVSDDAPEVGSSLPVSVELGRSAVTVDEVAPEISGTSGTDGGVTKLVVTADT